MCANVCDFVACCIDDSNIDTEKWLQRDIIYTFGWLRNIACLSMEPCLAKNYCITYYDH